MRQLILLCDGTNNNLTGQKADTHVVFLAEVLRSIKGASFPGSLLLVPRW